MENENLQNQQVNINDSLNIKDNDIDLNDIKDVVIDSKQFIIHLTRRVNKSLHYSKDCYTVLLPSEITNFQKLILYLYDKKMQNSGKKNTGLTMTEISNDLKKTGMASASVTIALFKLLPVAVEVISYKKQHVSRYFRLNEIGCVIARKLMDEQNEPIQNNN